MVAILYNDGTTEQIVKISSPYEIGEKLAK